MTKNKEKILHPRDGNRYAGNCTCCGVYVPPFTGHWQGRAFWKVRCKDCVGRGNEPITPRAKEQWRLRKLKRWTADFLDVEDQT